MAEFQTALNITLRNEGSGFTFNRATGEIVKAGITAAFLAGLSLLPPDAAASYTKFRITKNVEDAAAVFSYVSNLSQTDVLLIYLKYFWTPIGGAQIISQPVANKLFDVEVNQGGVAVKEMQGAINGFPGIQPVVVDGVVGAKTIAAINSLPDVELLAAFQVLVEVRYREIAALNPELAGDLKGWLTRLYEVG